jgi:hypothetical protein
MHYKHIGLIRDNITIKMSRVKGWQLQHGFHNEGSFYLGYGEAQGGAISTCRVLSYVIMVVHNYRNSRMRGMVQIKQSTLLLRGSQQIGLCNQQ